MPPNLFPVLRYDDAPAAIDFLAAAFGFEKATDHRMPDGRVAHADLRFGPGGIGVSSSGTSPSDSPWASVRQGLYIVATDPDADARCARAAAAGATIVMNPQQSPFGARFYAARDPEGYLNA
jgi:uncharacterized glyoxalase superfamily protein PhnB